MNTPRKKNRKDLAVPMSDMKSIDELMGTDSCFTYTSPSAGITIDLKVFRFSGQDILDKTTVHPKNKRIQQYLTALSLAPLIKSLQKSNQVSPALGRIEEDGSITSCYGSRRRMASYFGQTEYVIFASKDLTDEIAEEISDAENTSANISLIERGHLWLEIQTSEGLSSRDISVIFEESKVSHTIIAAGISGAKLPIDLVKLYPSTNTIGRTTISRLSAALENKSLDDILNYVMSEHPEVTTNLWDAYTVDNEFLVKELSKQLTNAITDFSTPKKIKNAPKPLKTNSFINEGVNAKVDIKGRIEYITFDSSLSNDTLAKVQEFLKNL